MAGNGYKGGLHNGFATLVKAIEELSHQKFDIQDDEKVDIRTLRQKEAIEASREIAKEREHKHKELIAQMHKQGRVNAKFTFNTIKTDPANMEAIKVAKSFCSTLIVGQQYDVNPSLLLIQGEPGTGKTVLCNCVANEFLEKFFKEVEIVSYYEIKRSRTPSPSDTNYDISDKKSKWDRAATVDLLIVDGFCQNNETLTVFDRQIFSELLRIRYENNLPFVISTTLPPSSIHAKIGDDCFEAIKGYNVFFATLIGMSRRQPIMVGGANLR